MRGPSGRSNDGPILFRRSPGVPGCDPNSPDATTVFPADPEIGSIRPIGAAPDPVSVNQTLIDLRIGHRCF